jgi:D-glycero-D-manno-heptose 1,7-bisphosphate phosphatase
MRAAIFIEPQDLLYRVAKSGPPAPGPFFELEKQAVEPLAILRKAGFLLIAVSNEASLLRSALTRTELDCIHRALQTAFCLDDILVCRHEEGDRCPCRKPRPGLLTEAAFKWHIDLDRSFIIGNRWQDAELARITGCVSLLVESPWIGRGHHDFVMPDIHAVTQKILGLADAGYESSSIVRMTSTSEVQANG